MNIISIIIIITLLISLITYFKANDEYRRIIVYEDWNDVGLSFFSIIFPLFIFLIMLHNNISTKYAFVICSMIMIILLLKLARSTYESNNKNIIYFIMAFITKIFFGITLFLQILNVISPSEDEDGNSNFWSSVLILVIIIPMVNNLIVNKNKGSKINPLKWIYKE